MFSNKSSEVVNCNSELNISKVPINQNIQTISITHESNSVQTVLKKDMETQTDEKERKEPCVDYEKLAEFLNRVTPDIINALDKTFSFANIDDEYSSNEVDTSSKFTLLSRIGTRQYSETGIINDLTWNVSCRTLAVTHSIKPHNFWCDHSSFIYFYTLTKNDTLLDIPQKMLQVNACIMALKYHPSEPSIIAAGLHNGDLLVWNLRDDNKITPIEIFSHDSNISEIYWKLGNANNKSFLISTTRNGYIYMHELIENFNNSKLHKKFKISQNYDPISNSRPQSASTKQELAKEPGLSITCIDFSYTKYNLFIVGTLCGGLYKCCLDTTVEVQGQKDIFDPVISKYETNKASITSIKCSPLRDLFIMSSIDKVIRIYDIEQHSSIQSIMTENIVTSITWMTNQNIFATCGTENFVKFYNLSEGKILSENNIELADGENATCMSINNQRNILAIGGTQANIELWKIPQQTLY